MITFRTPYTKPPMTMNDQRRAHWATVHRQHELISNQVKRIVEDEGLVGPVPHYGPFVTQIVWFAKDRRNRDTDGLGAFGKCVLDGLTRARFWPDDNANINIMTIYGPILYDKENPRIEVSIYDLLTDSLSDLRTVQ